MLQEIEKSRIRIFRSEKHLKVKFPLSKRDLVEGEQEVLITIVHAGVQNGLELDVGIEELNEFGVVNSPPPL